MKAKGGALESRVARILSAYTSHVRRNVMLRDAHGNLSEIDVVAGWVRRTYVECKHYAPGHAVPLEAVAKFKQVLELNGINPARGLFITTSTFTPRALTCGIRTMDGKQLAAWEAAASRRLRWMRLVRATAWLVVAAAVALVVAPWYVAHQWPGWDHPAMAPVVQTSAAVGTMLSGAWRRAGRWVEGSLPPPSPPPTATTK